MALTFIVRDNNDPVRMTARTYGDGNLALTGDHAETGEPWVTASVNLPDLHLPGNQFVLSHNVTEPLRSEILGHELVQVIGSVSYGFVKDAPLCRLLVNPTNRS